MNHCHTCGHDWTGDSAACPECADARAVLEKDTANDIGTDLGRAITDRLNGPMSVEKRRALLAQINGLTERKDEAMRCPEAALAALFDALELAVSDERFDIRMGDSPLSMTPFEVARMVTGQAG